MLWGGRVKVCVLEVLLPVWGSGGRRLGQEGINAGLLEWVRSPEGRLLQSESNCLGSPWLLFSSCVLFCTCCHPCGASGPREPRGCWYRALELPGLWAKETFLLCQSLSLKCLLIATQRGQGQMCRWTSSRETERHWKGGKSGSGRCIASHLFVSWK
jgi:hypothetical protein